MHSHADESMLLGHAGFEEVLLRLLPRIAARAAEPPYTAWLSLDSVWLELYMSIERWSFPPPGHQYNGKRAAAKPLLPFKAAPTMSEKSFEQALAILDSTNLIASHAHGTGVDQAPKGGKRSC
eukprot:2736844-Pleurochrysis_carterae.AAC.3